jgi:hypothetical protein
VVAWQVLITIDGPVVLIPLIRCGALIALDATHGQRVVKLREVPQRPRRCRTSKGG